MRRRHSVADNRMKNGLLIIGILLILSILMLLFLGRGESSTVLDEAPVVLPTFNTFQRPEASHEKRMINTEDGFIPTNDITADPVAVYDGGVYVVSETDTYSILYYAQDDFFMVSLLNPSDYFNARRQAELVFLQELGVTQQEACTMSVDVVIPPYIDFEHAGSYGLSFCANAQTLP